MKIKLIGDSFECQNRNSREAVEQLRHVRHSIIVLRGDLNVRKFLHVSYCVDFCSQPIIIWNERSLKQKDDNYYLNESNNPYYRSCSKIVADNHNILRRNSCFENSNKHANRMSLPSEAMTMIFSLTQAQQAQDR